MERSLKIKKLSGYEIGVKGVESNSRQIPEWIREATSTLPRQGEEPLVPSYAAADGSRKPTGLVSREVAVGETADNQTKRLGEA